MPSFRINDSVALVTGTNKPNGIGRAIVEALLSQGATKVYATARDASQLEDFVTKHGGKVVAVSLDVTNLEAIQALPEQYPDVTLIVNNAGYMVAQTSTDDIYAAKKEIDVNYIAPMAIAKSFAPIFATVTANSSSGTDDNVKPTAVVNVNSIASLINFPLGGTYSASKAATHSLTQAQRRDLKNSMVVGVYPGPIDTEMAKNITMYEKATPSTVAQAIVDALESGLEDVFPDQMAAQMYEGWKANAKGMEQQMSQAASA